VLVAGEAKTPLEQAVGHAFDLFVYAPIGMLFEGATLLPQIVEKGRHEVATARVMGRYAVHKAQVRATRVAAQLQDQTAGILDFLGDSVTPLPADRAAARPRAAAARREPAASATSHGSSTVHADELAIPDYDGLSASQVVNRLAGLSVDELRNVQEYESAHRGRKTILSKVAQLQAR
jgi:hypothetical protein